VSPRPIGSAAQGPVRSAHALFWLIGATLVALVLLVAALFRPDGGLLGVVALGVAAATWLAWMTVDFAFASPRAGRSAHASALAESTAAAPGFVDTEANWQLR